MTKILMDSSRKLNFAGANVETMKKNFSSEIYYIVRQFNEASNWNEESKFIIYKEIETQLSIYFSLFKDTKVLSECIDILANMYDEIQKFKGKVYPDIYGNYDYYCFESRFYHYYFK